ncbi:MAG TPA: LEA type 2 family protein [Steroidobacteraceae bacterium]|nr:LEA type 2 family protein [Steroidobacteraceae bacterium]
MPDRIVPSSGRSASSANARRRLQSPARAAPAVGAIAALALTGCSLFAPKLQAPTLSIVNIQLLKGDLWHQDLKVRLRVRNPNDRSLPIRGITYVVELDGEEFAHGESMSSFVVPPLGEAEFDMSASANMAGMLVKLLGQGRQIDYHLSGKVALSAGLLRSIPFDDHGTFHLQ